MVDVLTGGSCAGLGSGGSRVAFTWYGLQGRYLSQLTWVTSMSRGMVCWLRTSRGVRSRARVRARAAPNLHVAAIHLTREAVAYYRKAFIRKKLRA